MSSVCAPCRGAMATAVAPLCIHWEGAAGSSAGCKVLQGQPLGGTKKKLRILDDVVAWQRHITSEKAQGLLEELTGQLNLGGERRGELEGAGGRASAGLTEEARAEEGGAEGAGGQAARVRAAAAAAAASAELLHVFERRGGGGEGGGEPGRGEGGSQQQRQPLQLGGA